MKCDSQQQSDGYLQRSPTAHGGSAPVPSQTSQINLYMNTVWNMYEILGCSYRKDQMSQKPNLDLIKCIRYTNVWRVCSPLEEQLRVLKCI